MIIFMGSIFGFVNYLILLSISDAFANFLGVWLFYIQHQLEGFYWANEDEWIILVQL